MSAKCFPLIHELHCCCMGSAMALKLEFHNRVIVSILPSVLAVINPGSTLNTHTEILDYQVFFLLETILRMCCTLTSPISCHLDSENTPYNPNSYFTLNVTPTVVGRLSFTETHFSGWVIYSVLFTSHYNYIIWRQDYKMHSQIWIWIVLHMRALPSDTGNAKTNVEGQMYQTQSFYLAKEFRKKAIFVIVVHVLILIYFHFCQWPVLSSKHWMCA